MMELRFYFSVLCILLYCINANCQDVSARAHLFDYKLYDNSLRFEKLLLEMPEWLPNIKSNDTLNYLFHRLASDRKEDFDEHLRINPQFKGDLISSILSVHKNHSNNAYLLDLIEILIEGISDWEILNYYLERLLIERYVSSGLINYIEKNISSINEMHKNKLYDLIMDFEWSMKHIEIFRLMKRLQRPETMLTFIKKVKLLKDPAMIGVIKDMFANDNFYTGLDALITSNNKTEIFNAFSLWEKYFIQFGKWDDHLKAYRIELPRGYFVQSSEFLDFGNTNDHNKCDTLTVDRLAKDVLNKIWKSELCQYDTINYFFDIKRDFDNNGYLDMVYYNADIARSIGDTQVKGINVLMHIDIGLWQGINLNDDFYCPQFKVNKLPTGKYSLDLFYVKDRIYYFHTPVNQRYTYKFNDLIELEEKSDFTIDSIICKIYYNSYATDLIGTQIKLRNSCLLSVAKTKNRNNINERSFKIPQEKFDFIQQLLNEINFVELKGTYHQDVSHGSGCALKIYYNGGKLKSISDYPMRGTRGLMLLYRHLEEMIPLEFWKK